jgi:hypothetical protein
VKASLYGSTAAVQRKISAKSVPKGLVTPVTPSVSNTEVLAEISSNFLPDRPPTRPTLKLVALNSDY